MRTESKRFAYSWNVGLVHTHTHIHRHSSSSSNTHTRRDQNIEKNFIFFFFFHTLRVFWALCVWKIFYDSISRYKFSGIKRLSRTTTTWRDSSLYWLHWRAHPPSPSHTHVAAFMPMNEKKKKKWIGFHRMFSIPLSFQFSVRSHAHSESFASFVCVLLACELCVLVLCARK